MHLKRTLVIGNVVIAMLTALVPVLVGIYYQDYFKTVVLEEAHPFHLNNYRFFPLYIGLGLGFICFCSQLDTRNNQRHGRCKGDLVLKARTIPIVYGLQKSRTIAIIFVLITMTLTIQLFGFGEQVISME